MKSYKRVLTLILACIVSSGSLVSCLKDDEATGDKSDTSKNKKSGNTVVDSDSKKASTNEVSDGRGDGFEDSSFDVPEGIAEGKTFSIYFAMPTVKGSYIAEEETGNDVNDAVYLRNKLVEEHTGVKLDFVSTTRTSAGSDQRLENDHIRTLIQSGDTTYDAFIHAQVSEMFTLAEEGMFHNWNDLPYVNLDNEWWYSNVKRDICFGDKVFAMTGDYNLNSFSETECLLFNKTMCDELGLEYPYQMVLDGEWTHDRFVEYIKKATRDLNGNGKMEIEYDRYGFGGWKYEQMPALFAGYGGAALAKDEENMPVINVDNELTYTVVDKMIEVFNHEGAFYEGNTYGVDDKMFNDGRLLFNDSFLTSVVGARSIEEFDVGFIPYPKLDEDQEEYYSRTANVSGLTYIPVTNDDLETTGAVLESLAYYSSDTIMPVYFDILLTIKSTRDIESEKMIPIIRDSSRFLDVVIGFTGSGIVEEGNGNTLSSTIASNMDAWELRVETMVDLYS